jgi:hypothetical protein
MLYTKRKVSTWVLAGQRGLWGIQLLDVYSLIAERGRLRRANTYWSSRALYHNRISVFQPTHLLGTQGQLATEK